MIEHNTPVHVEGDSLAVHKLITDLEDLGYRVAPDPNAFTIGLRGEHYCGVDLGPNFVAIQTGSKKVQTLLIDEFQAMSGVHIMLIPGSDERRVSIYHSPGPGAWRHVAMVVLRLFVPSDRPQPRVEKRPFRILGFKLF